MKKFEPMDAMPSESRSPQFPYHIVWIATNVCNASCLHCSSGSGRRDANELDTFEAKQLLDELADIGVLDVAISGGEPLLRRDIFELIEHATTRGLRVGLGSNGSTITDEVVRRLAAVGLHRLQVSIDGLEKTHDLARCWPGLFRRAERAVRIAVEYGLRTHVCCTVHRMNHSELTDVFALCASWGIRRFNISRFVPTGRGSTALDLIPAEWERVAMTSERLRREHETRVEVTTHLAQMILSAPEVGCHPGFSGCQAGRGQGCVGTEGQVMPCVVLPVIIGNIRKARFSELWSGSPVIAQLKRRDELKGRCGVCPLREKCGGCRAVAYSYSGDYLAEDRRCWLAP